MRSHRLAAGAMLAVALFGVPAAPVFGDVLLITDIGTEGILQYDTATHSLTTFATQNQIINDLKNQPGAIAAVDAPFTIAKGFDGNIYFSNLGSSTIDEYNVTTQHFSQFLDLHNSGKPIFPGYITFATDRGTNYMFVNDFVNSQVLRYNTNGTPAPSVGNSGAVYVSAHQGGLNNPTGVVFSSVGGAAGNVPTLYVNSSNSNTPNQINTYTETGPGGAVVAGPSIGNIQLVNGAKLGVVPLTGTNGTVNYLFDMNFSNQMGVSVIQYVQKTGAQFATFSSLALSAPAGFDFHGNTLYIANASAANPSIVALTPPGTPSGALVNLNAGSLPIDVLYIVGSAPPPPLASKTLDPPPPGDPSTPEPHSVLLLGLGGLALAGYRALRAKMCG
jgi:hypothetical protein